MMSGSKRNFFWVPNSAWLAGTALYINKLIMNLSYAQAVIPTNSTITANNAISDTGATSHYIQYSCQSLCTYNLETTTGPTLRAANGNTMTATHSVNIPISTQLSKSSTHGHILDHLKTVSLISIGQLFDNFCAAISTKYHVCVIKGGHIVIKGTINNTNGLWNIPIAPKPSATPYGNPNHSHTVWSAINGSQTKSYLAAFLHGTAFSPITSTFLRAIKQVYFTTWPGITVDLISKHLSKSLATSKVHLLCQKNNIKSTKTTNLTIIPLSTSLDISPSQ